MTKELELLGKMDLTEENRAKLQALLEESKKTGKVASKSWSRRSTPSTQRRSRPSSFMTFWSRPASRSTSRTYWS